MATTITKVHADQVDGTVIRASVFNGEIDNLVNGVNTLAPELTTASDNIDTLEATVADHAVMYEEWTTTYKDRIDGNVTDIATNATDITAIEDQISGGLAFPDGLTANEVRIGIDGDYQISTTGGDLQIEGVEFPGGLEIGSHGQVIPNPWGSSGAVMINRLQISNGHLINTCISNSTTGTLSMHTTPHFHDTPEMVLTAATAVSLPDPDDVPQGVKYTLYNDTATPISVFVNGVDSTYDIAAGARRVFTRCVVGVSTYWLMMPDESFVKIN